MKPSMILWRGGNSKKKKKKSWGVMYFGGTRGVSDEMMHDDDGDACVCAKHKMRRGACVRFPPLPFFCVFFVEG